jgi:multidrug transporter EmrE-like cation transporter
MLPGYIAFPLSASGGIILVALSGKFLFKEKIGFCGMLGIALGVVAIALLAG